MGCFFASTKEQRKEGRRAGEETKAKRATAEQEAHHTRPPPHTTTLQTHTTHTAKRIRGRGRGRGREQGVAGHKLRRPTSKTQHEQHGDIAFRQTYLCPCPPHLIPPHTLSSSVLFCVTAFFGLGIPVVLHSQQEPAAQGEARQAELDVFETHGGEEPSQHRHQLD